MITLEAQERKEVCRESEYRTGQRQECRLCKLPNCKDDVPHCQWCAEDFELKSVNKVSRLSDAELRIIEHDLSDGNVVDDGDVQRLLDEVVERRREEEGKESA